LPFREVPGFPKLSVLRASARGFCCDFLLGGHFAVRRARRCLFIGRRAGSDRAVAAPKAPGIEADGSRHAPGNWAWIPNPSLAGRRGNMSHVITVGRGWSRCLAARGSRQAHFVEFALVQHHAAKEAKLPRRWERRSRLSPPNRRQELAQSAPIDCLSCVRRYSSSAISCSISLLAGCSSSLGSCCW